MATKRKTLEGVLLRKEILKLRRKLRVGGTVCRDCGKISDVLNLLCPDCGSDNLKIDYTFRQ